MSNGYKSGRAFKYFFIVSAIIISIASVWVTNVLVDKLKEEERKKIEIWAGAVVLNSSMASEKAEAVDPLAFSEYNTLVDSIMQGNTTIPIIVTYDTGDIYDTKNIVVPEQDTDRFLKKKVRQFEAKHKRIEAAVTDEFALYIYYDDSTVLKQLQLFPFLQLAVVFIFIIISFVALNSTQKAEQNRVWVGLSKETAHQLGTPISSLMAWVEYLKTKAIDPELLEEIDKDVQRLKIIAERFSKIGSNPDPEPMNLAESIQRAIAYLERRISSKVNISTRFPDETIHVMMNESLFGWVIENLIKNAVDAMDGQGTITISAQQRGGKVMLDIADTGKGIAKSKFDAVFQPGFTTKKRGWGLGLSLVKRIIESYRKGKIYVYKSEIGKGTTFRIELNS
jgi:signal transduction histidine kinase